MPVSKLWDIECDGGLIPVRGQAHTALNLAATHCTVDTITVPRSPY